jgi:hypothetical protein
MEKESAESKYQSKIFTKSIEETFGKSKEDRRKKVFYGIVYSAIILLVKYFVFGKISAMNYILELIASAGIVGIFYVIISFSANLLFFAPRLIGIEQEKEIERLNPKKANIEIKEIHLNDEGFRNYGQATKVGISIENNDYDLLLSVRILGDIHEEKRFLGDIDRKKFPIDTENRIIKMNDLLETKHIGKINFIEIQEGHILFCLDKKFPLAALKDIDKMDFIRWDFQFEVFGKIKDDKFDNGVFSTFIETNQTSHSIYLKMGDVVKVG